MLQCEQRKIFKVCLGIFEHYVWNGKWAKHSLNVRDYSQRLNKLTKGKLYEQLSSCFVENKYFLKCLENHENVEILTTFLKSISILPSPTLLVVTKFRLSYQVKCNELINFSFLKNHQKTVGGYKLIYEGVEANGFSQIRIMLEAKFRDDSLIGTIQLDSTLQKGPTKDWKESPVFILRMITRRHKQFEKIYSFK